jgi:ankyrin repeat protein
MDFHDLLVLVREHHGDATRMAALARELVAARNIHGDSLLHILAAEGDAKAVEALLEAGCDVNCQNHFGSAAITCPAAKEDWVVVNLLLRAGADLSLRDSTGSTVLENLRLLQQYQMADWLESERRRDRWQRLKSG